MNRILLIIFFLSSLNLSAQTQPRLVLPVGHSSSITKIVISDDSRYIATGNLMWAYWGSNYDEPTDENVIIWNNKGVPLHFLKLDEPPTHLSDFSFDNRFIITGGTSYKIWDIEKGDLVKELNIKGSMDCSDPINFFPGSLDVYYKNENSIHRIKFRDNSFEVIADEELIKVGFEGVKFIRTPDELTIFLDDSLSYKWNGVEFLASNDSNLYYSVPGHNASENEEYFGWIHPLNEHNLYSEDLIRYKKELQRQGFSFTHINKSNDQLYFDYSDSLPSSGFGGKELGVLNLNNIKSKIFRNRTTIIDFFGFTSTGLLYYESNGYDINVDFKRMIINHNFISDFNEWSHFYWTDGVIVIKNFGKPLVYDLKRRTELNIISSSNQPFGMECGGKWNCINRVQYKNGVYKVFTTSEAIIYSYELVDSNFVCIDASRKEFVLSSNEVEYSNKGYVLNKEKNTDFDSYKILKLINLSNDSILILQLNNDLNTGGQYLRNHDPLKFLYLEEESLIIVNETDRMHFFNTQGRSIFSFIPLDDIHFIILLDNGYYYTSNKEIVKNLHYYYSNEKVIGFEQLDPVYNRPDIVLDSIGKYFGNSDGGMIEEYRKSWEKRIDRLGLDKEKLGKGEIAVPNAEIVGADNISYENKESKLEIKVAANDPKYPLRRFNVYVNEVPLYGSAGISIAHLKKQVWDTTVSVPLSIGENKIQVSVMNELGLENFKYPSYVNYTPSEPIVAKTYYIGIGVNEFKEPGHKLNYCVKDVTDLSMSFGGPNTEIKLFTNAQVTKENILALKDYLSKTTVNDKVIISCSSHGLLDDSSNFYLATHDVDFNNPKARGLKYEALENLLDSIPARQKLLLLDACNSGENDKTEALKQELQQNEKSMDSTQFLSARGVIIKLEDENKSNFKKMNELFVNVRNNTGSVIISAAGGQESALEAITVDGKSIENGAFSFCVLEYLKNNSNKPEELTVNKLKNYVEKRVEEITNGKQQPTSRQETMEIDWGLR